MNELLYDDTCLRHLCTCRKTSAGTVESCISCRPRSCKSTQMPEEGEESLRTLVSYLHERSAELRLSSSQDLHKFWVPLHRL